MTFTFGLWYLVRNVSCLKKGLMGGHLGVTQPCFFLTHQTEGQRWLAEVIDLLSVFWSWTLAQPPTTSGPAAAGTWLLSTSHVVGNSNGH